MTRLACLLAVALLCADGARADTLQPWPDSSGFAILDGDPWDDPATASTDREDALVFSEASGGHALSPEAIAAAVRFDVELLARPDKAPRGRSVASNANDRVSWSFDRFTPVGRNSVAYATLDTLKGRAGPTSLAETTEFALAMLARR